MVPITDAARQLASSYKKPTIAVLGSHSALDICSGARAFKIPNLAVCQRGREATYSKYYKVRKPKGSKEEIGCVEDVMLLDKFADIVSPASLKTLQSRQSIFIPHRSFSVYVGYDNIESKFSVPIFGNRFLLRAEERNQPRNQRYLLEKAGVRIPKTFAKPEDISCLCIVKAPEAKRSFERAFFYASNYDQYVAESNNLLSQGVITKDGLHSALIEEFVLGAHFNFNFFLSPLTGELELLGIDTRRQTNLDGWLRLPAKEQNSLEPARQGGQVRVNNIEAGHIACTIRESHLDQVFSIGQKFVDTVRRECPPGPIGPFALQGAMDGSEKILIFDVSLRVPGSPGTKFTPYSEYLRGRPLSVGGRIALEVQEALRQKRLDEIVT